MAAPTSCFFVVPLLVRCGEVDHMVINYSSAQMRQKIGSPPLKKRAQNKTLYHKQTLHRLVERKLLDRDRTQMQLWLKFGHFSESSNPIDLINLGPSFPNNTLSENQVRFSKM